jgi:hypothetical protein
MKPCSRGNALHDLAEPPKRHTEGRINKDLKDLHPFGKNSLGAFFGNFMAISVRAAVGQ